MVVAVAGTGKVQDDLDNSNSTVILKNLFADRADSASSEKNKTCKVTTLITNLAQLSVTHCKLQRNDKGAKSMI